MKRIFTTARAFRFARLAATMGVTLALGDSLTAATPQRLPAVRKVSRELEDRQSVELLQAPVPDEPLTLEDLEQMALTGNPAIARMQALVNAARGNWVQVGLPPNPTFGYEGQQIGSRGLAEQDGAFVEQEIVRGGKLRLNRQIAAQDVARAQQELAAMQQRVRTDVRMGYYQVLVAQRQLELSQELVRIGNEGAKSAEALFNAKEVGRADVLQAQIEVENVQILIQNARNRYASAWQGLSAVMGRGSVAPTPLQGDLEENAREFAWDHTLEHLLGNSPEISVAVAKIERARWTLERARVEPRPNVSVTGLVNARDNGIGGASDGSLTVSVPLPAWDRNQGRIAEAQAEVAAAQHALEQLELELRGRLAPVYERYANARNQVERYRARILPTAAESLDLSRRSYQAGETSYLTLLTAQRTFSQTNLSYLDSLRELRMAESEIEGLLLSNSLEAR
ncbi:MAG TPA: TolC family protein [Pirellulaceae bacterium]|nr:TolC family protein [Pirellulaceae bacterium]